MRAVRPLAAVLAGALGVYALASGDLALRARCARREGEKYMRWLREPGLRRAHYDGVLRAEKSRLESLRARGRMDEAQYRERARLAELGIEEAAGESSAKQAYRWFQVEAELFSPPWRRTGGPSARRLEEARALWERELEAASVPRPDFMLE